MAKTYTLNVAGLTRELDISTVIQHTGNSAYGKPCLLCHIL